ncbi:MAG: outer membrane beta-barrel protein [Pseudomonadota bacterium]
MFFKARKLVTLRIALALCLAPLIAKAQAPQDPVGPYVDLTAGLSLAGSPSSDFTALEGALQQGSTDLKSGWLGSFAAGYAFKGPLRAEVELSYRSNSVNSLSTPGLTQVTSGDYASLMFFANGYYDITALETSFATFVPYVGFGVGLAEEVDADLSAGAQSFEFDGNSFAYQFLAGVKWYYDSGFTGGLGVRHTRVDSIALTGNAGALDLNYNPWAITASIGFQF